MEYLPDWETIDEWGADGYMGEVRRRNEKDREDKAEKYGGVALAVVLAIGSYVVYLGLVAFYHWVQWFASFLG